MNATNDTHGRGVIIVLQGESTRPLLDAVRAMERFANSEAVIIAIRKTKQATEDFKKTCSQLKPVFDSKLLMPRIPAMPVFAYKDSHSDVRGDFVVRGGRIVKVWNPWHSIWEFWQPMPDTSCRAIGRARPMPPVRSGCPPMNRGRHFDRRSRN